MKKYIFSFNFSRRYLTVDSLRIGFKQTHGTEMTCIHVLSCCKKAFDRVIHWTLAKKLLNRNMPLQIVKLFIFGIESKSLWYGGVTHYRWHSVAQMESGKEGSCHHFCIKYDLYHHLHATGVGCYVGGAWVNSLSYADDMVLLELTVTALQTLLEVCRAYAGPHCIIYNTMKPVYVCRPKQSQGQYLTRVRSGNEELTFLQEFRYQGHVVTADCPDDKNI